MTRAVALLLAIAAVAAPALADTPARSKKDRERADKSTSHPLPSVAGTKPRKLINLYNTWTHEWLAVDLKVPPAPETLDRFLRDHYTNEPTATEAKLFEIVLAAAKEFRSDTIMVVSAFRHPKYNLILRKKGHQVARDSHHSKGDAVDFYIPRVPTKKLHAWAKSQAIGGVGLYLDSGFVHMDTGAVRYWSGE